jgi:NAD(P)H-binding
MPGSPEPAQSTSTFWRTIMYAITGITGKVGGAVARSLLAERLPVRAVLRDEAKAPEWRTRGCEIALAEMDDAASLTSAFRGAAGVFILPPSEFDPEPGFPEAKRVIAAVTAALAEARPGKVVCLSTIGADAPHENLLTQRTLMEQSLKQIGLSVTFLRPGWFMENALWDVPSARDEGVLRSFLQPADKLFAMGRDAGCRRPSRRASPGERERDAGRRVGGARTHIAERSRPRLRHGAEAHRPGRDGAARELGADFPRSGNAKSVASDPDARRLQRGMD